MLGHVRPLLATLVGTDSERMILNVFYSQGIEGCRGRGGGLLGFLWISSLDINQIFSETMKSLKIESGH